MVCAGSTRSYADIYPDTKCTLLDPLIEVTSGRDSVDFEAPALPARSSREHAVWCPWLVDVLAEAAGSAVTDDEFSVGQLKFAITCNNHYLLGMAPDISGFDAR